MPHPLPSPGARKSKLMTTEVSKKVKQLTLAQALPLDEKIELARGLIAQGLELGDAGLAWSGGKDSTVLLHLARQIDPGIQVLWNNTGVEFPETWHFIKRMAAEWRLNFHIAKPEPGVTFWGCVEKYGWPLFGKDIRSSTNHHVTRRISKRKAKAIEVARMSSYCCDHLKEKPGTKLQKRLGLKVVLLGNMVEESRMRWWAWLDRGALYYGKKRNLWTVWPLWNWTDKDIWEYHHVYSLPHCKIYDMGHKRNGCWPCGMDIGIRDNHLSRLRLSHPKLWRFLIVEKGLGEELMKIKLAVRNGQMDFYTRSQIANVIELRPCYFDRLEGF